MARLVVTFFLVVLADQASKYYIQQEMDLNASIPVLRDLIRITYIRNPGAAFGIMVGNRAVFLALSLIACGVMAYYFHRMPPSERWGRTALILVLAGAVGNLIDRVRFGEVTDFIDVGVRAYRWPIFNVADMAVTVGVMLLFLHVTSSKSMAAGPSHPGHPREFIHREDHPA